MGKLIKAVTNEGCLRAYVVEGTDLVNDAVKIHNLFSPAAAALGRSLCATAMMGAMLKDGSSLTFSVKGGGPLGVIVCISDRSGNVKGYVQNPYVQLPLNDIGKIDVAKAVGTQGFLTVIKDMGLKEPYIGKVSLVSGEIGDDVSSYFVVSEQTPTVCALGVLVDTDGSVKAAGGYIVQLLPFAAPESVDIIERNVFSSPPISKLIEKGYSPKEILDTVLNGFEYEILEEKEIFYRCDCSKEKTFRALVSLGREELEDIRKENKEVEIVCNFCNEKYVFGIDEIDRLLKK